MGMCAGIWQGVTTAVAQPVHMERWTSVQAIADQVDPKLEQEALASLCGRALLPLPVSMAALQAAPARRPPAARREGSVPRLEQHGHHLLLVLGCLKTGGAHTAAVLCGDSLLHL